MVFLWGYLPCAVILTSRMKKKYHSKGQLVLGCTGVGSSASCRTRVGDIKRKDNRGAVLNYGNACLESAEPIRPFRDLVRAKQRPQGSHCCNTPGDWSKEGFRTAPALLLYQVTTRVTIGHNNTCTLIASLAVQINYTVKKKDCYLFLL